jgi:hypothetical protein
MYNPGATARRLSHPPPPRLAVVPPTSALLTDDAGATLSTAIAAALVEETVPAISGTSRAGDWRLLVTAETRGTDVVPSYTVQNAAGATQGTIDGTPVAASAWAAGDQSTLKQVAASAGPAVAALLTRIEAAIQRDDPNSLVNRPARIQLGAITGAPGDGSISLARQLRLELTKLGETVQDSANDADFVVTCKINAVPEAANTTRIEIQWIVNDGAGPERGRIVQINEIPSGTLDHYWGDVAVVVTQQAAGGIREVIVNQLAGHPERKVGSSAGQPHDTP